MGNMGATHEFMEVVGQPARPQFARALGNGLTSLKEWAHEHLRPPPEQSPSNERYRSCD